MAQIRNICLLLWCAGTVLCQAKDASAADGRLQVLNFSMDRCEPCKAMQPVLAKLIVDGWQIRQIDIAQAPQLVAQYKLQSAPTLVMLAGGREVDRVVGAIAYNKLLTRLETASRSIEPSSGVNRSGATQLSTLPSQLTAPPSLAQRGSDPGQLSLEPQLVRGQSPGPADVPDLDVDNQRMLEFVKDLPEAPKFAAQTTPSPTSPSLTNNAQLASSSSNIGLASIARQSLPARNAVPTIDPQLRAHLATVRIRIEDANSIAFGTGTVISVHEGQALVLTCGHLFRDLGQGARMSIDVYDSMNRVTNVPALPIMHTTDQGDIGVMEFKCPYPIVPVPIAKHGPSIGDRAYSWGCDRGADPTRRDTEIKRINRYIGPANVEIKGAPVVGRSGGGLFNAQGQLIGVCNAADAEDDEGIYAALPVIEQHVAGFQLDSLHYENEPSQIAAGQGQVQLASATMNNGALGSGSMTPLPTSQVASSQPPTQVRCVIRDTQGKETALLIDQPSPELVAMLKQAALK